MKWEWNNRLISRVIGISLSVSVMMTVSIASQIAAIKKTSRSAFVDTGMAAQDSPSSETVIVPFDDIPETDFGSDSERVYRVYRELTKAGKTKSVTASTQPVSETAQTNPESTTTAPARETTDSQEPPVTTTTTTAATAATTAAGSTTGTQTSATQPQEPSVTNGQQPFRYDDVVSVAADLDTLGDFINAVSPLSVSWDTQDYEEGGCVSISLISRSGKVTLKVKPVTEGMIPYVIDGTTSGSRSMEAAFDWEWYEANREAGCNISSVTWTSAEFPLPPVRGIGVGTSLAELTDRYLCVNGGATTLYKASDVISDQAKLNALSAAENSYTFVGGRCYPIDSYLEKYYSGRPHVYEFADSEYVVQYGCNSIMEQNYVTGSWLIEYAVRENSVIGITFMNKSYYSTDPSRRGTSTESTAVSSSSASVPEAQETTAPTGTADSAAESGRETASGAASDEDL